MNWGFHFGVLVEKEHDDELIDLCNRHDYEWEHFMVKKGATFGANCICASFIHLGQH